MSHASFSRVNFVQDRQTVLGVLMLAEANFLVKDFVRLTQWAPRLSGRRCHPLTLPCPDAHRRNPATPALPSVEEPV